MPRFRDKCIGFDNEGTLFRDKCTGFDNEGSMQPTLVVIAG